MTPDVTPTPAPSATVGELPRPGEFVAVNFISCTDDYRDRFERLFTSRAHAIDGAPGFRHMSVLRPARSGGDYLVVSFWKDRASFETWSKSPEFLAGHRRGFGDIQQARERGEAPPMSSRMETYEILCD